MATDSWEHQVLDIAAAPAEAQARFAAEGAGGWELVAVVAQPANPERLTAFMKRRSSVEAAPPQAADADTAQAEPVERTVLEPAFDVVLIGINADPMSVVIALARHCPALHLKDAKRLVSAPPGVLATISSLEEAEQLAAELLLIGAIVEVVAR